MRPVTLVLVLLALAIAGVTALLAIKLVSGRQAPPPAIAAQPAVSDEEILVASSALKEGTVLKSGDLAYVRWPGEAIDKGFIRRGAGTDPRESLAGSIVKIPLAAGQPLKADALFRQDQGGLMAGLLSPGMRAVALPVTAVSAAAGFILPNDRVDVVLSQDLRAGMENPALANGPGRFETRTVLADLRVLAVDDKLSRPADAANLPGHTVTVEVSPKDAEILLVAARMGELTLVLRSLAEPEAEVSRIGLATSDTDLSRTGTRPAAAGLRGAGGRQVSIDRGGSLSVQSFPN